MPDPTIDLEVGTLWSILLNDDNTILDVQLMDECQTIAGQSWNGDWLSPMGVDLQINGGLGIAFSEITYSDIPDLLELLDQLWIDGVDAISPTVVTSGIDQLRESLLVFREARKYHSENRCKLLGSHLEGPFIDRRKIGAHAIKNVCSPSSKALEQRIKGFENEIALFTLAPELSGAQAVIERLNSLGIVVCLGHSSANFEVASHSFSNGVTMLTHAFNAMSGLHHRYPGPIAAASLNGEVSVGLIADGVHVHPAMVAILKRLFSKKVVLITDALAPYGLGDGEYKWEGRKLYSFQGTCRLEDQTLAGTTVRLLDACCNFAKWCNDPLAAIWSATMAPRRIIGDKSLIKDYLVRKNLKQLIRWNYCQDMKELQWQHAN